MLHTWSRYFLSLNPNLKNPWYIISLTIFLVATFLASFLFIAVPLAYRGESLSDLWKFSYNLQWYIICLEISFLVIWNSSLSLKLKFSYLGGGGVEKLFILHCFGFLNPEIEIIEGVSFPICQEHITLLYSKLAWESNIIGIIFKFIEIKIYQFTLVIVLLFLLMLFFSEHLLLMLLYLLFLLLDLLSVILVHLLKFSILLFLVIFIILFFIDVLVSIIFIYFVL